jgi:hypothetical protein
MPVVRTRLAAQVLVGVRWSVHAMILAGALILINARAKGLTAALPPPARSVSGSGVSAGS